ncbi:MAG TPA: TIGR01777 family oxidoreductase [Candidatus Acidoferrales bacterium]|nr:TIGR01777 family oxidoreductase [Candidatus Acidoferrales bacterium]
MKIIISGSSGLIGSTLVDALRSDNHQIARLVRSGSPSQPGPASESIRWEPPAGSIDLAAMEGADAIVHLAGASIGDGRWTSARKEILRRSRVDATHHLVGGLRKLQRKPRVLVSASAVGFYGDRGDETLTESSGPGNDFLAQICRGWESEVAQAEESGIRTVSLRFGVILAEKGGALKRMLPPFRLGVGGRLGNGRQWMSWLTLDEAVSIIRYSIDKDSLHGPVNAVSPNPVTNSRFTSTLASALRRPAIFPAPRAILRLALGEMADALLFSSQRVIPQNLRSSGYQFRHSDLREALRSLFH